MEYHYKTHGTCSSEIIFSLTEDQRIKKVKFINGCDGNTKGISALCVGRKADEIIKLLEGITCDTKKTSCPDQFAKALKEVI